MKLIGNRILVEKLSEENKTAAGIIIPKEQHKDNDCLVLMVGPKAQVKVGDKIRRYPNTGTPIRHEDKNCLFLKEDDHVEFIY